MPQMIIIAGPNGSGKSTSAPSILKGTLCVDDFVNADTIAKGLSAFSPEKEAIRAGRIMLDRMHAHLDNRANFAFETTLATRSFVHWIKEAKEYGYTVTLLFFWLRSVEVAISRVHQRVVQGGHHIPEATIRRRYQSGLKNFFNLYMPLLDHWKFLDNSDIAAPKLVAKSLDGSMSVYDQVTWDKVRAVIS